MILYIEQGPAEECYRLRVHENRPLRNDLMSVSSKLRMVNVSPATAKMLMWQQAAWDATLGVIGDLYEDGKDAGL